MGGWADSAACIEYPTEIFFSDTRGSNGENRLAIRLICAHCPVRNECLESALAEEQDATTHRYGVRGGMTAHEREMYWKQLIDRRAGWCPSGKHIVEYEQECDQCNRRKSA